MVLLKISFFYNGVAQSYGVLQYFTMFYNGVAQSYIIYIYFTMLNHSALCKLWRAYNLSTMAIWRFCLENLISKLEHELRGFTSLQRTIPVNIAIIAAANDIKGNWGSGRFFQNSFSRPLLGYCCLVWVGKNYKCKLLNNDELHNVLNTRVLLLKFK